MAQHPQLVFGESSAMRMLLEGCTRFAPSGHRMLFDGPPGSGKTALARYVHQLCGRRGDFGFRSAAAIPEHLEESFLFGHRRYSFTDAREDRAGVFEAAHGGTFLLNEFEAARPKVQQLLLEVMDEHSIQRFGENHRRPVDVHLLATTNADLNAMRDAGTFRADLLGRFRHFWFHVPPLNQRREEILLYVEYYLGIEGRKLGRTQAVRLSLKCATRSLRRPGTTIQHLARATPLHHLAVRIPV